MTAAALGDVADFINGYAFKPEDWHDDGLPIVRIQNLTDSSKPINLTTRVVPDKFRVRRGELLVSWSATLGVFVWDRTDEALVNQHIFRVVPSSKVDQDFLRHMLEGALVSMERHLHGATMRHVNRGEFLSTEIPLPTMPEQRRIAAILDRANDLRAKRRQVLAHLDTLTQSIFHGMFDKHSIEVSLGSVIQSGPSNGLYRPRSDYGSGTPILRIDSFDKGAVHQADWKRVRITEQELKRFGLTVGDGVINRVNALSHLGKSALIESLQEPAIYESNMMRIRLDTERVMPMFVNAWIQTPSARGQVLARAKKAINQASINQTDVIEMSMPLPPLERQNEFAERVNSVNAHRAVVLAVRAADDEFFASLQSRAFRGEL